MRDESKMADIVNAYRSTSDSRFSPVKPGLFLDVCQDHVITISLSIDFNNYKYKVDYRKLKCKKVDYR
jgi:hypothetical protein